MKKRIEIIGAIIGILLAYWAGYLQVNQNVNAQKEVTYAERRVMCGNYYDYMVIETVDENDWLLDDTKDSPYIENGISVFEDGELVQVVFDTMGTEMINDDVIMEVRSYK